MTTDQHDTDRRFWQQVREDDRRTALCHPDDARWVRELLAVHGLAEQILVQPTPDVDPGRILLLDHNAVAANERQAAITEM